MGTIMLKICQPLTVPNSDVRWWTWFFHWRQRLVQSQIHKPSNSKKKLTIKQLKAMPIIEQRMIMINQKAKGDRKMPKDLFVGVEGSASIATVFYDKFKKVATKMVSEDTYGRFKIEEEIVKESLKKKEVSDNYSETDIDKAYLFVESKNQEYNMETEYNNLVIGYNQLNHDTNMELHVPEPYKYWEDCNAYSMEYCKGETAAAFLEKATETVKNTLDIQTTVDTDLRNAGWTLLVRWAWTPQMTVSKKVVHDALKSSAPVFYMLLRMSNIMENINAIIEEAAKVPFEGTKEFLIHTDPSLGNIMFQLDEASNDITPYLIDFGDVCVFDLKNEYHQKLLEIFQRYVTAVKSINPGWNAVKPEFERAIDAVGNDASMDEQAKLSLRVFKAKLKDTMVKYKSILGSTAKLLAGPLKQAIASISGSIYFTSGHPFYQSVSTIKDFMNNYIDADESDDNKLDDFEFTQVAINLFNLGFNSRDLDQLMATWEPPLVSGRRMRIRTGGGGSGGGGRPSVGGRPSGGGGIGGGGGFGGRPFGYGNTYY